MNAWCPVYVLVSLIGFVVACDRANTQREVDETNNPPRADAIESSNAVLLPNPPPAATNRSLMTNSTPSQ